MFSNLMITLNSGLNPTLQPPKQVKSLKENQSILKVLYQKLSLQQQVGYSLPKNPIFLLFTKTSF